MSEITNILRSKGLKVTPQRLAILNIMMNTQTHPTAENIYKALSPTNPTMSLATVYKTLDCFAESSLITTISIGKDSLHYDFNTDFHPHFVCTNCNNVFDVMINFDKEMEKLISDTNSKTKFKVTTGQLFLYGLCDKCQ